MPWSIFEENAAPTRKASLRATGRQSQGLEILFSYNGATFERNWRSQGAKSVWILSTEKRLGVRTGCNMFIFVIVMFCCRSKFCTVMWIGFHQIELATPFAVKQPPRTPALEPIEEGKWSCKCGASVSAVHVGRPHHIEISLFTERWCQQASLSAAYK